MNAPRGDKIHPPTPRRRQRARQQGHVARSRDLVAAGVLLAAAAIAWMRGGHLVRLLSGFAVSQLGGDAWLAADADFASDLGRVTLQRLAVVLLPLLGFLLLAAVGSQISQFGLLFLPERLAPDVRRIDPAAGWRRMWSAENCVRLGFALLKLAAVLLVAGWTLWGMRDQVLAAGAGDVRDLAGASLSILTAVAVRVLVTLAALAVADYAYQRWCYERELWMTDEEMREEMRDEQTDPLVSRRRRQLQQQVAQQHVSREVPRADLIVTAGSSLAIAIEYDPDAMPAPRVLAKGFGSLAAEIYRVAQQHGRWIVDERKLARQLYRRVPAGQEVPSELYPDVARALAELPRYRQR